MKNAEKTKTSIQHHTIFPTRCFGCLSVSARAHLKGGQKGVTRLIANSDKLLASGSETTLKLPRRTFSTKSPKGRAALKLVQ